MIYRFLFPAVLSLIIIFALFLFHSNIIAEDDPAKTSPALSPDQINEYQKRLKSASETEEAEEKKVRPEDEDLPTVSDRTGPEEVSTIEKIYRIQYSDVILDQLGKLDYLDKPDAFEQKDEVEERESKQEEGFESQPNAQLEQKDRTAVLDKPFDPFALDPGKALLFEKYKKSLLVEKYLTQFGYDLFLPGNFARPGNIVCPDDYILGSGDVLRVNIWGSGSDIQIDGTIRPDGTVTLPKLGVIPLSGVRYGEVREIISKEAGKYFQGINLNVTIIQPRSLEIYVVGQVRNPGLKMAPAFSTALNALVQAGGPLKVGSLRNIVVYRRGRVYRELDLYNVILHGDTSNDILLKDKDVIHVPYIGPTVAVVGTVRRPGIFEMKARSMNIDQALALAGGALPQAQAKVNLRRFADNRALNVLDVDLTDPHLADSHVLDGDLVEIRYIEHKLPRTVTVTGHVWDEQVISYREGLLLSDVVPGPEKLKPEAITEYALLRRLNPTTTEYKTQRILLSDVWSGKYDFKLQAYDEIKILAKTDYGIEKYVYLRGAVWSTGIFPYQSGATLRDLIALGGGLKEYANIGIVEITRQTKKNNRIVTQHFQVDLSDPKMDEPLKPFDMVRVPYIKGAGVIHEVQVQGEVRFPGKYAIIEGEQLSDLISRAGGFLPSAYLYGARFYSTSAQTIQQQSINRLIEELEVRLAGATVGGVSSALSGEAATISTAQQEAQTSFINKLKSIKATGRVTIKLVDLETFRGSQYDFTLENGDSLEVPSKPVFVNVLGSVYAPNSYLYNPNLTLRDYLDMAGGPTKTSDTKYISLHKANGEVNSLASMSSSRFYRQNLMPGDSILVPENLERVPHLRYVMDISDIIYKITVTLGVAANLVL